MDELEQLDGLGEVLEVMRPEVAEGGAGRQRPVHAAGRRGRDQDLAAGSGAHDAGGAVDVDAYVVRGADGDRARVDAHPDANPEARGPTGCREALLGLQGGI